jgi:hypothetical protein
MVAEVVIDLTTSGLLHSSHHFFINTYRKIRLPYLLERTIGYDGRWHATLIPASLL